LETSGAAAAGSTTGGTSVRSDDKYIVLTGTQNCMKMSTTDAALSCLQTNVRIAMDAVSANNARDAAKQLQQDISTAKQLQVVKNDDDVDVACNKNMVVGRRDTVQTCASKLNFALMAFIDNRTFQRNQANKK
jgi:hypothetical protein